MGNQPCYAAKRTPSDDSFTLTARAAGDGIIAMVPYPGCERNGILDLRCGTGLQYFLTAWVKHATKITLSAPNAVRHGAWFTVSGRLTGTTGAVVLDRSWDGTHWSTFALKHVGSNGRFSVRTRLGRAGTVQIKASFPEAPLFAASSATIAVRAV